MQTGAASFHRSPLLAGWALDAVRVIGLDAVKLDGDLVDEKKARTQRPAANYYLRSVFDRGDEDKNPSFYSFPYNFLTRIIGLSNVMALV